LARQSRNVLFTGRLTMQPKEEFQPSQIILNLLM
jgi:hypothetical protein